MADKRIRLLDRLQFYVERTRIVLRRISDELFIPVMILRFHSVHGLLSSFTSLLAVLIAPAGSRNAMSILLLPIKLLIVFLLSIFLVFALIVVLLLGTGAFVVGLRNTQDYSGAERALAWIPLIAIVFLFPFFSTKIGMYRLETIMAFTIAIIGLNFVYVECGILSLGHGGFLMLGAYTTVWLANGTFGFSVPLLVAVAIASLAGVFVGLSLGLPALRIKDQYLIVVTVAFTAVVPLFLKSAFMAPYSGSKVGGVSLERSVPHVLRSFLTQSQLDFFTIAAIFFALLYIAYNLKYHSQFGRALRILRSENEVAHIFGVSPIKYKLMAFSITAAYGMAAGGMLVIISGFIFVETYSSHDSVQVLIGSVLGGKGFLGAVGGASFLMFEQDISRWLTSAIPRGGQLLSIANGLLLIAAIYFFPEGIGNLVKVIATSNKNLIRRWMYNRSPPPDYDLLNRRVHKPASEDSYGKH